MHSSLFPSSEISTMGEDDTVYSISAWPAWLAEAGAVVAIVLLLAFFVRGRREPRAWLAVGVGLTAGTWAAGIAALVTLPRRVEGRYVETLFRDTLIADMATTAVGVGVLVTVLLTLLIAWPRRPVVVLGLVAVAASASLAAGSRLHARSLVAVRYLPFFAVEGLPDIHIGREWDMPVDFRAMSGKDRFASSGGSVTYAVDPDERALWGAPPTVHVRAEHQGRFAFPAQARRGPVRLTSTLHFRGRRELANPLLPLRVGNRWLYRVVTKGDWGGFAYVVPLGGERSEDRLELKITGVDERSGLRTFTLAALGGDGSIRESKVVAMDGETLTVEDDGTVGPPAISGTEEACTLGLLGRPGGITDDEVSGTCQAGGADADMLPSTLPDPKHPGAKPVPLRFALAGPASLRIGPSLGAEAGKWVLGIMTGGAVIVPVRSTTVYTLVETQRGPEGAPEAPTASR